MAILRGVVTIAQESRFQLVDDDGVSHLLIAASGAAEPEQLADLARRQARIRVETRPGRGVLAAVATSLAMF